MSLRFLVSSLSVLLVSGFVLRAISVEPPRAPVVTAFHVGPPLALSLAVSVFLAVRRRESFRSRLSIELVRLNGLNVAPVVNEDRPTYRSLKWLPVSIVLIGLVAWLVPSVRQEWPFRSSTSQAASGSVKCPDVVHAAKPPGRAIVYDVTGDACGFLQYPRADIESLSWESGSTYTEFIVKFTSTDAGNAGFTLTMGPTPWALRSTCSAVALTANLPSVSGYQAFLTTGCENSASPQDVSSHIVLAGSSITVLLSNGYVPANNRGYVYVSVAAATKLSEYSSTVISDYLPDAGLPPIRIKLG